MKVPFVAKILLVFLVFLSSFTPIENPEKNKLLLNVIMQNINAMHFHPQFIDDDFSAKVFDLYLKRIDYNKRFLTLDDFMKLKKYQYLIDDEIEKGSFEFFDLTLTLLNKRIEQTQKFYKDILANPFDYEKNEEVAFDYETRTYAENDKELYDYWRKHLKYLTISTLHDLLSKQEEALQNKDSNVAIRPFDSLELKARRQIIKRQENYYKIMDQVDEADRLSLYINSIINVYDPHTEYYPPRDKENFDIDFTGQLEGIGATLTQRDGYIRVHRIIPGSASWKQGELEEGDIILKVAQADDEAVDIVDMRLDKAVNLIRGKKGTEVRLTVKKLDGTIREIGIIRDVVIIEETYAKAALLNYEKDDLRVGYIYLPKFYAPMDIREDSRSCSEDVKNFVEQFNKENVEAIVIDLRNNGGGSLTDAVKIAGLFIDKGPVVQVKNRFSQPFVLNDPDEGIVYKGALIVLVNTLSASASEIFAAAIQDYNRGIIIGGNSTFGKGTVQRFFDLDENINYQYDQYKPFGSLKITLQKFYRIDGGATQLKGVVPDIILPEQYSYVSYGEKEADHALEWTKINPVPYENWNPVYNLDGLKSMSKKRIGEDSTFIMIEENALRLKKQQDKKYYNLNLSVFREEQKQLKKESKKYDNFIKVIPDMKFLSLPEEKELMEKDSVLLARVNQFHKDLSKDPYLFESIRVVGDIKSTAKK
jgi:carboxyl-terminal processing protease